MIPSRNPHVQAIVQRTRDKLFAETPRGRAAAFLTHYPAKPSGQVKAMAPTPPQPVVKASPPAATVKAATAPIAAVASRKPSTTPQSRSQFTPDELHDMAARSRIHIAAAEERARLTAPSLEQRAQKIFDRQRAARGLPLVQRDASQSATKPKPVIRPPMSLGMAPGLLPVWWTPR